MKRANRATIDCELVNKIVRECVVYSSDHVWDTGSKTYVYVRL